MADLNVRIIPGTEVGRFTGAGYLAACRKGLPTFQAHEALHSKEGDDVTVSRDALCVHDSRLWKPLFAELHALYHATPDFSPSVLQITTSSLEWISTPIEANVWPVIKQLIDGRLESASGPVPDLDLAAYAATATDAFRVFASHASPLVSLADKQGIHKADGSVLLPEQTRIDVSDSFHLILEGLRQRGTVWKRHFLKEAFENACKAQGLNSDRVYEEVRAEEGDCAGALADIDRLNTASFKELNHLIGAAGRKIYPQSSPNAKIKQKSLDVLVDATTATKTALLTQNVFALADAVVSLTLLYGVAASALPYVAKESRTIFASILKEPPTLEQAISECRSELAKDPENMNLHRRLASLLVKSGATDLAVSQFTRMAELGSQRHNVSEEIQAYEGILKLDPEHEKALLKLFTFYSERGSLNSMHFGERLCAVYEKRGAFETVIPIYQELIKLHTLSFKKWLSTKLAAPAKPDHDLKERFVNFHRWHFWLASAYEKIEQNEESASTLMALAQDEFQCPPGAYRNTVAIETYKHVLDLDPEHEGAFQGMLAIISKGGQTEEAFRAGAGLCQLLLKQNNKKALAVFKSLVEVGYWYMPFYEGLVALFTKLDETGNQVSNLLELADLALKIGFLKQAVETYSKVLTLQPDNQSALTSLLRLHLGQRDSKLAIPVGARLAGLQIAEGKLPDAILTYEKLLELAPEDQSLRGELISLYEKTGQPKKAIPILMKQAESAAKLEQFNVAIGAYTQVISLDDSNIDAHYQLGIIYADFLNNLEAAQAEYSAVLKLNPEHTGALSRLVKHGKETFVHLRKLLDSKATNGTQAARKKALEILTHFMERNYPFEILSSVVDILRNAQTREGFVTINFIKTAIHQVAKQLAKNEEQILGRTDLSPEEAHAVCSGNQLIKLLPRLDRVWVDRVIKEMNRKGKEKLLAAWASTRMAHAYQAEERNPLFWEGLAELSKHLSPRKI